MKAPLPRIALAFLLLLGGVVLWAWWPEPLAVPEPVAIDAAAATPTPRGVEDAPRFERQALAVGDLPSAVPAAADHTAWTLRVTVLDDGSQPVAGATVEVFHGEHVANGAATVWLGRAPGAAFTTATSDAQGCCRIVVDSARVYVGAWHPAFGRSVAAAATRGVEEEVQLWLGHPVLVRGTVIDAARQPVPFARVHAESSEGTQRERMKRAVSTDLAACNADGRFAFEAEAEAWLVVDAEADGHRSLQVPVVVHDGVDVVVPFAGALCISGRLLDADGQPVGQARIELMPVQLVNDLKGTRSSWRPPGISLFRGEPVRTGSDGAFSHDVLSYGSYWLAAVDPSEPKARTGLVECAVTPMQPDIFVELRLLRPVAIRGRVLRADGQPVYGAVVQAEQTGSDWGAWIRDCPSCMDTTSEDGSFAIVVAPRRRWRVAVQLEGMVAAQDGVASEAAGIELVPRVVQLGRLRGEVVRLADGQPVERVDVCWINDSTAARRGVYAVKADGNRFDTEIPDGDGWTLHVSTQQAGLGGAMLGPFTAGMRESQELLVRLPARVLVPVRVVDPHGTPLRGLQVVGQYLGPGGSYPRTDADGRVELSLAPGAARLAVVRGFEQLAERRLVVGTAVNPEAVIVVTL